MVSGAAFDLTEASCSGVQQAQGVLAVYSKREIRSLQADEPNFRKTWERGP